MALYVSPWRSVAVLLSLCLASSVTFFLTTNFAVWAFEGIYSHDLAGLTACYVAALPFFKNTIIGDLFWTCRRLSAAWDAARDPGRRPRNRDRRLTRRWSAQDR